MEDNNRKHKHATAIMVKSAMMRILKNSVGSAFSFWHSQTKLLAFEEQQKETMSTLEKCKTKHLESMKKSASSRIKSILFRWENAKLHHGFWMWKVNIERVRDAVFLRSTLVGEGKQQQSVIETAFKVRLENCLALKNNSEFIKRNNAKL